MESLVNRIIEIDRMADGRINDAKSKAKIFLKALRKSARKSAKILQRRLKKGLQRLNP